MPTNEGHVNKELFVFDLDGTLARSKTPMDSEMDEILTALLSRRKVAVIGGGWFPQFEKQLLATLTCGPELLENLYLFPTSGSRYLRYEDGTWQEVYSIELSKEERDKIFEVFEKAFKEVGYEHPEEIFGEIIEDRGTQVTFSALGQQAPVEKKEAWKGSPLDRRHEIVVAMLEHLEGYEIKVPGKTSIDVTKQGIDKGYGVEQMRDRLGIAVEDMIFYGDALYEGGNDEPVKRTGIEAIPVESPEDTKRYLREWLERL